MTISVDIRNIDAVGIEQPKKGDRGGPPHERQGVHPSMAKQKKNEGSGATPPRQQLKIVNKIGWGSCYGGDGD